jgi:putative transposase
MVKDSVAVKRIPRLRVVDAYILLVTWKMRVRLSFGICDALTFLRFSDMKFDPRIHHRKSIRLSDFAYAQAGLYYVTIVTYKRERLFGDVEQGRMFLSEIGEWVQAGWHEIPAHHPHALLHAFVVMPDHLHGIVEITPDSDAPHRAHAFQQMAAKSLATIVNGFKGAITRKCRQEQRVHDVWQRGYYERVIRNEQEYAHFSDYIHGNPARWRG